MTSLIKSLQHILKTLTTPFHFGKACPDFSGAGVGLLFFLSFSSAFSQDSKDWFAIDSRMAREHNVCKKLQGNVLVYAIWVDTKSSLGWTNYDINTATDSINRAITWLQNQATKNNIQLHISFDYLTSDTSRTVEQNLPGPVSKVLAADDGIDQL